MNIKLIPKQLKGQKFIRLGHPFKWEKNKKVKEFNPKDFNEEINYVSLNKEWSALGKRPKDFDWQNSKNFSEEQIQPHLKSEENYGVLTGYNNLGVLDDDTPDKRLLALFKENFGVTFMVRDHYYIWIIGLDKKIIFYDDNGVHCGELQWEGQQVVGPNSVHPSGAIYEVTKDIPIITIEADKFKEVFKDYIPQSRPIIERAKLKTNNYNAESLSDIPITSIVSTSGFKSRGKGLLGPHPYHGATNGGNFFISNDGKTWVCYRCNQGRNSNTGGGDVWALIAVVEGIISCRDAGRNCLSEEQAKEVRRIAISKYGLRESEKNETREPMGWAKSINIKDIANKYDLNNCPNCETPFSFNEDRGYWKCNICKTYGVLKTFMDFINISQIIAK